MARATPAALALIVERYLRDSTGDDAARADALDALERLHRLARGND